MATTSEPRALSTALASPAFVTKASGMAQHAADRHVERWAPETPAGTNRVRSLRNLGFVDRLVAPWIEAAQRSASLRMFSSYQTHGAPERQASSVSWVFPRPWYQDELDWMAAARQQSEMATMGGAGNAMLTTRGTYAAPIQRAATVMPAALYDFVAPSLSIARPEPTSRDAYSPLVPHAATQAASVMARVMAPLAPTRALSPGLRAVLTTMLERTAHVASAEPTRLSLSAPELVTPPAPRAPVAPSAAEEQAVAVADSYAEQRARIVELQRAAAIATQREVVAREAARVASAPAMPAVRDAAQSPAVSEAARSSAITTRAEAAASSEAAVAAERARLEERIAQRMAERQAEREAEGADRAEVRRAETVRTQEQARAELSRATEARRAERQVETQRLHESAREAAARDARSAATRSEPEVTRAQAPRALPAEVTAALAALPPQLQSIVAAGIAARPEHAADAISELGESLRTIELMARSAATGGSFESSRGPRLMMPAGLGGLVSTIEHTMAEPAATRGMSAGAARAALASDAARGEQLRGEFARAQATGMTAEAARAAGFAPEVVRALEAARPSVRVPQLSYIAARAGAPGTATALGATAASEPAALQHVAWADRWLGRFAGAKSQSLDAFAAASAGSPEMRFAALASAAPNAVFVAPAFARRADAEPATFSPGAADRGALAARELPAMPVVTPAEPPPVVRIDDDAETPDDLLAAISQAATRARRPAAIAQPAVAPTPAVSPTEASRAFERDTLADLVAHAVPAAPGAGLAAQLASSPFAPALRHVMPLAAAPAFDVRSLFGGGLSMTYLAGLLAPATREIAVPGALPTWASWDAAAPVALGGEALVREVPDFAMPVVAPAEPARATDTDLREGEPLSEKLTTVRSALLSWNVDAIDAGGNTETRVGAPSVTMSEPARMPAAYAALASMTLPTIGEAAALRELGAIDLAGTTAHASSYAAPGAIAERAQSWSVAQERSSADLAFDFVPPELVLAARVYGLGPAAAAQAARLALAGPGQLSAMAGAVDRTFVQAFAIEHERRTGKAATAYPAATPSDEASQARATAPELATRAFGVERRMPRGAFLWPSASVAALGLHASAPDGDHGMSVAALELLAAQAVAELGTFAALAPTQARDAARGEGASERAAAEIASERAAAPEMAPADEPTVLATASTLVGSTRRAKFEAMYVALGQSNATRSWSPAARAARALALAGRGDELISARERAEIAWDVLPVVSIGELGRDGEPTALSTGQVAQRAASQRQLAELGQFVEQRPGLSTLSSRAGEALGHYVAPQAGGAPAAAAASSSSSASRELGAVHRAPTAAPELVQTGPRFGGGEVELPAWFEQAAKKMFEDKSGLAENIQLSELTLVQTAPANIAASSRGAPSAMPAAPSAPPAGAHGDSKVDVDKVANDVYHKLLGIMDATRSRNGDPYL